MGAGGDAGRASPDGRDAQGVQQVARQPVAVGEVEIVVHPVEHEEQQGLGGDAEVAGHGEVRDDAREQKPARVLGRHAS